MSDIRIISADGGIDTPSNTPIESKTIDSPVLDELQTRYIGNAVGIERDSEFGQFKDKIHTLLEYAKSQTEDHSPESLKWVIRSLELKLGTPPFSEKRVSYLARFAYLDMEGKRIEAEKSRFIQ